MLSFREFYEVEIAPVLIHGDCVHDEMEVGDFVCVLLAKSLVPELLVDLRSEMRFRDSRREE